MKFKKVWAVWIFTVLFGVSLLFPIYFMVRAEKPWIKSAHLVTSRLPTSEEAVINQEQTVGQTFMAPENDLARIDLIIKRPKNPAAEYVFSLRKLGGEEESVKDGELIRQGVFQVKKIQEIGQFYFEPIADSKGENFYFYLQTTENMTEPASLFLSVTDLENGDLYLNHERQEGDLIFQIYDQKNISWSEFGKDFFRRMNQNKPWFLQTPLLYGYMVLFFAFTIVAIFFLLKWLVFVDNQKLVLKSVVLGGCWLLVLIIYLYIQTQVPILWLGTVV